MSGNWSNNHQINSATVTIFQHGSWRNASILCFPYQHFKLTNPFKLDTSLKSGKMLQSKLSWKRNLFSQVSDQWVTCHLSLNLLKSHQLTSWVTIWTKCGLYHRANQLIDHSTAQKQYFWRYSLIFYWTWMIRKSLSLSCLTSAQHSTQLTTVCYWKPKVPVLVLVEQLWDGSRDIFPKEHIKYKLKELFQKRNGWPLEYHMDHALGLCCSPSMLPTFSRS